MGTLTTTRTPASLMPSRNQVKLDPAELSFTRASQASLDRWKLDLTSLLRDASKRFADVAWTLHTGDEELICAHKAIIYARASGQFQLKYLSAPAPSPHSRLPGGLPSTSSVYLNASLRSATPQSAISHQRPSSPSVASLHSTAGSTRQLALLNGTDPTLFQSILEALYTANGLSEVFAFLFDDHAAADSPEARTDKLRKDLLYMWRSKLYADCQIVLINQHDLDNPTEDSTYEQEAVFSAHRAILCSRSPYFASLLLDPYADSNNRIFTLASPPFTPASLHFSLGYLYCGTLDFSNRNFDLSTATQIWRSAQYLGLELLREEVEAKISEMCHNFKDTCKSCISRIGRVYAFSLALDVASKRLEKAAEPFVVQHFGLIWNKAIGELHYEAQTHVVDLVCLSIDPNTVIGAIQNSKRLKDRLANERSDWADHLLSMLEPVDEQIGVVLQQKFPAVVTAKGFLDLLVGVGFSNDVLEKALITMVQKLTDESAAETYQVLVGQVLLREDGLPMDARVIVEDAKAGVLRYIRSHWTTIRALNGFDPLENWALKEISDEIDVSIEDLLLSTPLPRPRTKTGLMTAATSSKSNVREDVKSVSAASLRASVLSRNASRTQPVRTQQSPISSSKERLHKITTTSSTSSNTNGVRTPRKSENSILQSPAIITSPQPKAQAHLSRPFPSTSNALRPAENRISPSAPVAAGIKQMKSPANIASGSTASIKSPTSPKSDGGQSSKTDPDSKSPRIGSPSKSGEPSGLPSSYTSITPRRTRVSRPPSPAQSSSSVVSKEARLRTGSNAVKLRRPVDPKKSSEASTSRPPRTRTATSGSVASTRTTNTSAASQAQRKSVANQKPPAVRKIPSSMSMRSDTSTATIAAHRSRLGVNYQQKSSTTGNTIPISPPSKKAPRNTNNLAFPSKPDRLRTTSATARTGAATNVQATVPSTTSKRPSSVASVRTTLAAKASASASGLVSPTKPTPGTSTSTKAASKIKARNAGVPPLPTATSPKNTPQDSRRLPPISRASKPTTTTTTPSRSGEPAEVLADLTASSEVSDAPSHQSMGSSVSNSTIRLPSSQAVSARENAAEAPPSAIIVTPSSSSTISHLAARTNRTAAAAGPSSSGSPQASSKPPGTVLLIGIPCVVATTTTLADGLEQPVKFRAVVKYLGETFFGPGQWVGVEVAEKEEMVHKAWNDGTVDGVRYFELGQESKESKLRLFRNLSATPSGSAPVNDRSHSSSSSYLNSNPAPNEDVGSLNSLRPSFVSKSSSSRSHISASFEDERPTRGLFVRPQEVIFVF
ncbi:hypothetical protein PCANC_08028 [Puccinia coronata f. sp. avenae]|uniref:CAP-Gly domain-containing protein n=1 Tax=Puccinia coronata f. sp. avenae TaxID=200324 RepID=A0A2N5SWD6_9BASI|nr:hypothetical protein PCANC_08028 [Puccinia coronata f. sp. avenae]PLW36940.1 hypothetical protein PCASD_06681 [Puccinia coronata f. sp. avenae]